MFQCFLSPSGPINAPIGANGPTGPQGAIGPAGFIVNPEYDRFVWSIVHAIHEKIPDHVVSMEFDGDLIIFPPNRSHRAIYKGKLEDCDIKINGRRIRITTKQRKELVIWKVLLL
jgi:hypothetical protein